MDLKEQKLYVYYLTARNVWLTTAGVKRFSARCKRWMAENIQDHVDCQTDRVLCTALANACADHFDMLAGPDFDTVPEDVYEWAAELAFQYEEPDPYSGGR